MTKVSSNLGFHRPTNCATCEKFEKMEETGKHKYIRGAPVSKSRAREEMEQDSELANNNPSLKNGQCYVWDESNNRGACEVY